MQKEERQTTLLKLIDAKPISRQEELAELLEKKGFVVTQSSISRDLVELGIVKLNGVYAVQSRPKVVVAFGLKTLDTAGANLIVAKCDAGMASAVCVRIDNAEINEIVGTIAGEDTIFIAVSDAEAQKAAVIKIWGMFEN